MEKVRLFGQKQVRSVWDEERELWYFSIVDVVGVLTDSPNPRKYWSVLKTRLKKEGSQLATTCSQLKLKSADGKSYPDTQIPRSPLTRTNKVTHRRQQCNPAD